MLSRRSLAALLASLSALAGGCQSTGGRPSPPPLFQAPAGAAARSRPDAVAAQPALERSERMADGQAPVVLRPGMEVQWAMQTAHEQPGQVKNGTAVVGPDGTMVVGPYGTCRVGGMSMGQATTALERHVGQYVKTPNISVSTVLSTAPADVTEVAFRPAGTPSAGANPIQTISATESPTPNQRQFQQRPPRPIDTFVAKVRAPFERLFGPAR